MSHAGNTAAASAPGAHGALRLRQRVLLPLLAFGMVLTLLVGFVGYRMVEAQIMGQLRQRALQVVDAVSVATESVDRAAELQRIVAAIGASPDLSLIVVARLPDLEVVASNRVSWLGSPIASVRDVPIHRALGNLQDLAEPARGHDAPSAQGLDQQEQSIGAPHGGEACGAFRLRSTARRGTGQSPAENQDQTSPEHQDRSSAADGIEGPRGPQCQAREKCCTPISAARSRRK